LFVGDFKNRERMKRIVAILLATGVGFAAATWFVSRQQSVRHAAQLAEQQAAWQAEKAELEAALERARNVAPVVSTVTAPAQVIQVTNKLSPEEILERLKTMKAVASQPRSIRRVVHQFENLIECGPVSLPAIREFLTRNQDIEYDTGSSRPFRDGKVPTEFTVPPSLRLGLLEVVKNIGGDDAEQLLADVLKTTGRGLEVAYLAFALNERAPNKYRDAALTAARALLARPLAGAASPLDKFERDYLYAVLSAFKDGSYVAAAQAQLIQPNGQIDQVALRYLQQTLGQQSIALAVQAWQDPRIPPDQKEPLARLALTYAGADPQADQLYQTAINDARLSKSHRSNLIEDLNETGFPDPKRLTQGDLALIQKRIALIEQLAPNAMDEVNAAAFKEAYKDLINMQNSLTQATPPKK
jgi:CRISPR/Cas system CMR-associated protein Cmr5 small subunit